MQNCQYYHDWLNKWKVHNLNKTTFIYNKTNTTYLLVGFLNSDLPWPLGKSHNAICIYGNCCEVIVKLGSASCWTLSIAQMNGKQFTSTAAGIKLQITKKLWNYINFNSRRILMKSHNFQVQSNWPRSVQGDRVLLL